MSAATPTATPAAQPPNGPMEAVTGVQLAQGIGHQPARAFWADAWARVLKDKRAVFGLAWITLVAFLACFAPVLASGHPIAMRPLDGTGAPSGPWSSPLWDTLSATDLLLILGGLAAPLYVLTAPKPRSGAGEPTGESPRAARVWGVIRAFLQATATVVAIQAVAASARSRDAAPWLAGASQSDLFRPAVCLLAAAGIAGLALLLPGGRPGSRRVVFVAVVALAAGLACWLKWTTPLERFDYRQRQAAGQIQAVFTLIPFSPSQASTLVFARPPGTSTLWPVVDQVERDARRELASASALTPAQLAAHPFDAAAAERIAAVTGRAVEIDPARPSELAAGLVAGVADGSIGTAVDAQRHLNETAAGRYLLGTDAFGQDVLSRMLHACRLSISIGLVSTGIAVLIGVTIGAIMGYFGGWIDLVLYRVVEIFMAIPVLFLLIVAASVLPRNTYVMMIIIGCVTWTGAARFTRAEFLRLRNQDFVQAARAAGLPLRSVLFKHMLPNGVTPVLVDTSFAIAAAILVEATLSYLGLGPADQPSWGALLTNARGDGNSFSWWLAVFPGLAIFLTVLSYNLVGEVMRDAIDPKLRKARV
jgi:ABC-type dipeptide/oligopeptide/nickel transport system permease subunit